jgi:uncharacterized protein
MTTCPAVLVLFCRRPSVQTGKQRLAAVIGAERACRVAQALLDCALEDAHIWPGAVVISPADPRDAQWAMQLLDRPVDVVPQPDGGFGERLEQVDRMVRARGATHVVFIGSDAPSLDGHYYAAARAALVEHDFVLGPAAGGGVALMGARVHWSALANLPWSESTLCAVLSAACRDAPASVAMLPMSYDVDTATDLDHAAERLRSDDRPARRRLLELLVAIRAGSAA